MVNSSPLSTRGSRQAISVIVRVYGAVVIATLVALVVLSLAGSRQATPEAWVHAVIVSVFAVLLPVRARAAEREPRALIAVGVIASVLVVVNGVEALIPGLFPGWMRIEMAGIAALMAGLVVVVVRTRR